VQGDGTFSFNIVGESYHQQELYEIAGGYDPDGLQFDCHAILLPEPDNPYDRYAVKVLIDDIEVGHLSRDKARQWSTEIFVPGGIRGIAAYAKIVGGYDLEDGTPAMIGVKLDISFPMMAVAAVVEE